MKRREIWALATAIICFSQISCSVKSILFQKDNLEVINREIVSISNSNTTLVLNNKRGSGMAVIQDVDFDRGTIELELKGENNPGKSFVGLAFNIQNDSTYEAVYFRPFNFQSEKEIRRKHAIQYIYHPKNTWKFLRTNFEGQFEAEFPRRPSPNNWFGVRVKIDDKYVTVYDQETNSVILSIERLTKQVSNKIGLWTGFNSKGAFRNLKIK